MNKQHENSESGGRINIKIKNERSTDQLRDPSTYISLNDSTQNSLPKKSARNGAVSLPRFSKISQDSKIDEKSRKLLSSKYTVISFVQSPLNDRDPFDFDRGLDKRY